VFNPFVFHLILCIRVHVLFVLFNEKCDGKDIAIHGDMSGATSGLARDVGEICTAVAIRRIVPPALWVAKPASALDVSFLKRVLDGKINDLGLQLLSPAEF
jgi:hypothetical protein